MEEKRENERRDQERGYYKDLSLSLSFGTVLPIILPWFDH
jgi:hypothetical protein